MRFKRHVDAGGIHPRLWQVLGWLDQLHLEWTEGELWVTSLRRPYVEDVNTRHAAPDLPLPISDPRSAPDPFVTAADIRRWALDELGKAEAFCRYIQDVAGDQIGVVLEPEWLSLARRARMTGPHIHLQLKRPIRWTTLV